MKYGNRPLWKRIMASPLTLIAAFILFIILARAAWTIHSKASLMQARLDDSQAQYRKLEDRQGALASKVAYLSTDQGIEAEMRTKYHAVREGEQVAVIVNDSNTASVAAATSTQSVGWFRGLLRWFGL